MDIDFVLLVFAVLLILHFSSADLKVDSSTSNGLKQNLPLNKTDGSNERISGSNFPLNATEKKKEGDQADGLKEVVGNVIDKNNSSRQSGSKESLNVPKGKRSSIDGMKGKIGDDKGKLSETTEESKKVPVVESKEGDTVSSAHERKKGSWSEECDSSSKCTDEKNKLVACLRVPGNDSPDLSLLIQNKGKGPLAVTISASNFVHLETTKVRLEKKEDKKVKVSIRKGGTDSLIILMAGDGQCRLDFRDLIAHSSEESDQKLLHVNFLTGIPTSALLLFAALVIVVSAWVCIRIRQNKFSSSSCKYEKLDMELPVSDGTKLVVDSSDSWDNGWGNDWDDEEAPQTPSVPVTPIFSSKGLASRRLSKEGLEGLVAFKR
ncbi:dentin sialophosphoprotein-like isoform X2 [Quillaja saponaria]|uniref:Dentin sialophosphoprotein-like isoform X2 n=1 Tax=Quillaja saponaria TaxID=32244 RepID=A0AAD7KSJ1_QUISA|nr:dentin sialophosphoprotein-like isoform X2 [Quillaja saponaria]